MRHISRRLFLGMSAAAAGGLAWGVPWAWSGKSQSPETAKQRMEMEKKQSIGLALGAGGANGLAHILMLEVFDELGLVPDAIAGCSIGSIMGALYASGKSAQEIKAIVDELVVRKDDTWKDVFLRKDLLQWVEFLDPEIGRGGFISGDAFLALRIFPFWILFSIPFKSCSTPLSAKNTPTTGRISSLPQISWMSGPWIFTEWTPSLNRPDRPGISSSASWRLCLFDRSHYVQTIINNIPLFCRLRGGSYV